MCQFPEDEGPDGKWSRQPSTEERYINGILHVNNNGTITFTSDEGQILRVTHIPAQIPKGTKLDIVALEHLTSITPINQPETLTPDELADEARAHRTGD